METSSQKPLPAVPRSFLSPKSLPLTVEERLHRHRFLEQAFKEAPWAEVNWRAWIDVFEDALDELGDSIARGGWLAGLKNSKVKMMEEQGEGSRRASKAEGKKEANGDMKDRDQESSTAHSSQESSSTSETLGLFQDHQQVSSSSKGSETTTNGSLSRSVLQELRELVSKPASSDPSPVGPVSRHLLLCLEPQGDLNSLQSSVVDQDGRVLSFADEVLCSFSASVFALPNESGANAATGRVILYGLREWEAHKRTSKEGDNVRVVGGTFFFRKVLSPEQIVFLAKVLRMAIYVHLSLLLEQTFLTNCGVELKFPQPKPLPAVPSTKPPAIPRRSTGGDIQPKVKHSIFGGGGILSYFSKKTENLFHQTATIGPVLGRGGSLDLVRSNTRSDLAGEDGSRQNGRRMRTFSFLSDSRSAPSFIPQVNEPPVSLPFNETLEQIKTTLFLLSTSVGVKFPPPSVLVALADKERKDPTRRLKGDEKAALGSVLGWEGKEMRGKGMSGTAGFLRQQSLSVLFSQHVPVSLPPSPPAPEGSRTISRTSSSSSARAPTDPIYAVCDAPRWVTFRYYSDDAPEKSLGDALVTLCETADKRCQTPGCQFMRGQHEFRWIHNGVRIVMKIEAGVKREKIMMRAGCKVCKAQSEETEMGDGTYLYSFGKFLEALAYSPLLCAISPPLCEHTTPSSESRPQGDTSLPRSRFNIVRYFSHGSRTVSVTLSAVEDIFHLRTPRLQIIRSSGDKPQERREDDGSSENNLEDEKRNLRREIVSWWHSLSEHIDKLERSCDTDTKAYYKSLPRLPSADDTYEESESEAPLSATPRQGIVVLPPQPGSIPPTPSVDESFDVNATITSSYLGSESEYAPSTDGSYTTSPNPSGRSHSGTTSSSNSFEQDPIQLLEKMRQNFQRTEQSLYAQLARTPLASLNEVRRAFLSTARGASKRLSAWQHKHLPQTLKGKHAIGKLAIEEPEWWHKECHVEGGGNIVVREGDWGSIISFTLSSADFQQELVKMSGIRMPQPATPRVEQEPCSTPTPHPSLFTGTKLFANHSSKTPDPDREDVVWHEPETYSAVISRKENPRDPAPLLSIREVLRKGTGEGNGLPSPRMAFSTNAAGRIVSGVTPPSAWAKPAVQVSMQAADGVVSGLPDANGSAGKILQEMESAAVDVHTRPSSRSGSFLGTNSEIVGLRPNQYGKSPSLVSLHSDVTARLSRHASQSVESLAPLVSGPHHGDNKEQKATEGEAADDQTGVTHSTLTATLSGIAHAMRYVMSGNEPMRPISPIIRNQHGLLSLDPLGIDDRPHIKYEWTIGKRVKFSCTAYYAKQFDALRRRCGLGDVFLKSLRKSTNWAADGGKSKSNFWKTADDRYIIKTLVNAWNVADLQVLIELGPSYFRYMDSTASRPTVLAKLLGFYTVEIKNLENGNTQAKADLLIMENLFYDQNISKMFDLKGIPGRKVKAGAQGSNVTSKTLFDGEWIEGQQRTLTLVHPDSKMVLREALRRDCEFLAQSNIMDYSLLLGIDERKNQIACGLVDTIGSYTFAKTLEYKAKQGLNAGKDVTVIPPNEYQERFVNSIERYFLACPDKWSRPPDFSKIIDNPDLLPSVL